MHRSRFQTVAGVALAAIFATGAAISAQKNPYRSYTQEKFVQNMQSADRNYSAVTALIAKSDYESAKAQLTRAREQMAITVTFWRDANRDDAVAMLRKVLTGMDDLDIALGAEKVDPTAVTAASEHIAAACQACHAAYREQDPSTKAYRVRRLAQ
jgi:cytochrome c556